MCFVVFLNYSINNARNVELHKHVPIRVRIYLNNYIRRHIVFKYKNARETDLLN